MNTYALASIILDLVDRKIKRQDIQDRIQELEVGGATPEDIQVELIAMRDQAIDIAQQAIDDKRGS
jgi:hypothetical protein